MDIQLENLPRTYSDLAYYMTNRLARRNDLTVTEGHNSVAISTSDGQWLMAGQFKSHTVRSIRNSHGTSPYNSFVLTFNNRPSSHIGRINTRFALGSLTLRDLGHKVVDKIIAIMGNRVQPILPAPSAATQDEKSFWDSIVAKIKKAKIESAQKEEFANSIVETLTKSGFTIRSRYENDFVEISKTGLEARVNIEQGVVKLSEIRMIQDLGDPTKLLSMLSSLEGLANG